MVANFVLPKPRPDGRADRTDERGRAYWALNQTEVAHGGAGTNHHFCERSAGAAAGENDNREVGPGWLGCNATTQKVDRFFVQRLFGDDGSSGSAAHAPAYCANMLHNPNRNSRTLQYFAHQYRVLAKRSQNQYPVVSMQESRHQRSTLLQSAQECGCAGEHPLELMQRRPDMTADRAQLEFPDSVFVTPASA